MSEKTLDISWETIVKVLIAASLLYFLFVAREVVIWFFFSLIISLLLEPAINFLQWLRLPKIVATILVYLSIFGVLGVMVYFTAPIFIFELDQLSKNFPIYFEKINPVLKNLGFELAKDFKGFTANLVLALQESSGSIFKAITTFFGGILSSLFIFSLAFFISLEDKGIEKVLALLAPKRYEGYILSVFEKAQMKVAGWFGARILACIFVGITSFVLFFLLGIKYPFILALISGVLNFIPFIGPTVTMIVAVVFVLSSDSWLMALYVTIAMLVIQEIENKALTPILMKKFIDLPPVLVLVSLLFGGAVFGFLGTIFAVPVFGIIYELSKEFFIRKKEESTSY